MSSFRILRPDRQWAWLHPPLGLPGFPASLSPSPSFLPIVPRSAAAPGLRSPSQYSLSQASGVSGSRSSGSGARGVPGGPPPQPRAPLCDRSARGRRCVKAEAHRRGPTRTPARGPRERQEGGGARRREAQNPIADPPAAAPPPPLLCAGAGDAEPRSALGAQICRSRAWGECGWRAGRAAEHLSSRGPRETRRRPAPPDRGRVQKGWARVASPHPAVMRPAG